MLEIFRQKVIRLVRGEDGVALVVTLALFMMLYVSCAGVFAVGRAVKERIILQNAADAAAYSAAVVEADILSRIATINRAMAWKYRELLNRQMDWIVSSFCHDTHYGYGDPAHPGYATDRSFADSIASVLPGGIYNTIRLSVFDEDSFLVEEPKDKNEIDVENAANQKNAITSEIDEIEQVLSGMMNLVDDLKEDLENVPVKRAEEVLKANLPSRLGKLCGYMISSLKSADIFHSLQGSEAAETQFLGFAELAEDGIERSWFEFYESEEGLARHFVGSFHADWMWQKNPLLPVPDNVYSVDSMPWVQQAKKPTYFVRPQVLKKDYFPLDGDPARGAISVAITKRNVNPWADLFGRSFEELIQGENFGLHDVFSHAQSNDWTIVLASAQAGYQGRDAEPGKRQYSLEWKDDPNGQWNLSTDDWDALFIPVPKAFSAAGEDGSLYNWLKNGTWKTVRDDITLAQLGGFDASNFDELNKAQLPRMHKGSESGLLDWDNSDFLDLIQH